MAGEPYAPVPGIESSVLAVLLLPPLRPCTPRRRPCWVDEDVTYVASAPGSEWGASSLGLATVGCASGSCASRSGGSRRAILPNAQWQIQSPIFPLIVIRSKIGHHWLANNLKRRAVVFDVNVNPFLNFTEVFIVRQTRYNCDMIIILYDLSRLFVEAFKSSWGVPLERKYESCLLDMYVLYEKMPQLSLFDHCSRTGYLKPKS